VLAGAGLFQFSALKYRCLEQCRTPFAFVASRWHGRAPAREALRLGIDHGLFCVGCCFALMLVMFVVGTASIGWMIALAALMAAEKNLPGGTRLRLPIGLGLLASAAAVVLANRVAA
jgi:predicted metal-binding membrane protein